MTQDTPETSSLTADQGRLLVKLARNTIRKELGVATEEDAVTDAELASPPFDMHCGTFVTLNKNGRLRGCIGNLSSNEAVADGVRRNAVNAAFHDPRFSPVNPDELDFLEVEVSVLTAPRPLDYKDAADLLAKMKKGVDGVILEKGFYRATFLPQVWEQLPDAADFLTHLCRKAGLPGNAWETSKLDISTYQVEYFED